MGLGGAGWWMGSGWMTSCYPYCSAPLQPDWTCSAHLLLLYQHQLASCQPLFAMPGPEVGTDAYTSLAVSGRDLRINLINKWIWLFLLHKDANLGKGCKFLWEQDKFCEPWHGFLYKMIIKYDLILSQNIRQTAGNTLKWHTFIKKMNTYIHFTFMSWLSWMLFYYVKHSFEERWHSTWSGSF